MPMSHTAVKAVLDHSQAKGAARLVALVYAEAVNEGDVRAGRPWLAWLSQRRAAERANVTERMVRFALTQLCEAGEMRRTGELRGRGTVVYDLLPGVHDEVTGCRSGNPLPDEDSQERELQESAPRQSAAPIRQPVTSQSGNPLPPEPEGTGTSEPEGDFPSSEIIEGNSNGRVKPDGEDAWDRFLAGGDRGGDYEPDDLATSMRDRVRGAA